MIREQFSLRMGHAVDAEALVYLQPLTSSEVNQLSGSIRGPHCQFARTLQAEVPIQQLDITDNLPCLGQVLIPDPCYWTSKLPFQYDLHLSWRNNSGEAYEATATLGLRRWACEASSFKLERSRIVLRGIGVGEPSLDTLEGAREAEAVLITKPVEKELFDDASSLGVPLIVDCSSVDGDLNMIAGKLSWSPSVLALLIDVAQQSATIEKISRPSQPLIGGLVDSKSDIQDAELAGIDFLAFRLRATERPPKWIHETDRPVVAIRDQGAESALAESRRECDALQSELAPEFDLAGYFVTS